MDILLKNKKITQKYILSLENFQNEIIAKKKDINRKIVELSNNLLNKQSTKTEFPMEYFSKLTNLKLDFKEIEEDEKTKTKTLLTNYYDDLRKDHDPQNDTPASPHSTQKKLYQSFP